jgi:glycosyltransferase involved in cell wall biosynthesis
VARAAEAGLRIVEIPGLDGSSALRFPAAVRALGRFMGAERFDIVNAHRGGGHLAAALAKRGLRRVALVRTRGDIRRPRSNPLSRALYSRWTDRVILSGEFMRSDYDRFDLPADRLVVLKGGVDLARFRPAGRRGAARRALGLPEAGPVAGIVARLSPVKGHSDFLQAAALARRAAPAAVFLVAGGEHQVRWASLEAEARRLGIESSVRYLGEVGDVRAVMAALDVGVVASRGSEAVCRVAMEYLASGVPVVATRVGVLPEIVSDGEDGRLVPPADPPALGAALASLLADPALAGRLGASARRSAEARFDLERFAEETEAVYRESADA